MIAFSWTDLCPKIAGFFCATTALPRGVISRLAMTTPDAQSRIPSQWGSVVNKFLFPTKAASAAAGESQFRVQLAESRSTTDDSEQYVRQAVIHARQDLVLLYEMQIENHRQLVKISRGIWAIAILLIIVLVS